MKQDKAHGWWEHTDWIPAGKGLELSRFCGEAYEIRCKASDPFTFPKSVLALFAKYGVCGHCGQEEAAKLIPCGCGKTGITIGQYTYYWVSLAKIDSDTQYNLYKEARNEIHKLYERERKRRRRQREREAEGFHTDEQVLAVWHLQDGRCYYCGDLLGAPDTEHAFQKDHVVSLDLMGTHWIENIALTCVRCNSSKGAMSEKAFRKELSKLIGSERVEKRAIETKDHKRLKRKLRF